MERDELISHLYDMGLLQKQMVTVLNDSGYNLSERQLRRILKRLSLCRRQYSDLNQAVPFILHQLTSSGLQHGYRWMWQKLKKHGINVRKEDARVLLAAIDPEGRSFRQMRRLHRRTYIAAGPHFAWHSDGYDKIKPFGFGIHGCIDGYSRHVIWLKVYVTNNNPAVVASYFKEAILHYGGCPKLLRTDRGTENVNMAQIQQAFPGSRYIAGTSTSNQRIEQFWGHLRRQCIEFWIALFHELQEEGIYLADYIDKNLLQLTFLGIIQDELDGMADVWNQHIIRKNRHGLCHGRPRIMMNHPELYGTRSHLIELSQQDMEDVADDELCATIEVIPCDADIYNLACQIMRDRNLAIASEWSENLELYKTLRRIIKGMLL